MVTPLGQGLSPSPCKAAVGDLADWAQLIVLQLQLDVMHLELVNEVPSIIIPDFCLIRQTDLQGQSFGVVDFWHRGTES